VSNIEGRAMEKKRRHDGRRSNSLLRLLLLSDQFLYYRRPVLFDGIPVDFN